MQRFARYQGAIVHDHQILLLRHTHHDDGRSCWLLPGGGIEQGESEEACVARKLWEETSLQVRVERLLLDEPAEAGAFYQRRKTYLHPLTLGASGRHLRHRHFEGTMCLALIGWSALSGVMLCSSRKANTNLNEEFRKVAGALVAEPFGSRKPIGVKIALVFCKSLRNY